MLADWTEQPYEQVRQRALSTLARHVRQNETNPKSILKKIVRLNRNLGLWCVASCVEVALPAAGRWAAPKDTVRLVRDYLSKAGRKIDPSDVTGVIFSGKSTVDAFRRSIAENEEYPERGTAREVGEAAGELAAMALALADGVMHHAMESLEMATLAVPTKASVVFVRAIAKGIETYPSEPVRENPTGPAVSLVAIAFRKHPDLLRELRSAEGPATIDHAAKLLSEWSGRSYSQVRAGALATLAQAMRDMYTRDTRRRGGLLPTQRIITFLIERSHALGVWCACQCARAVFEQTTEPQARFCVMAAERWVRDDEIDANLPGFINASRTSTPLRGGRGSTTEERAIIKDASNWSCSYAAESIANRSVASDCVESAYDVAKYRVGTLSDAWLMDILEKAIVTFPSRL